MHNIVENKEIEEKKFEDFLECEFCSKRVNSEEFDKHVCFCEYCDEILIFEFITEHKEMCGNRTEFCDRCNGYILKKNYKLHIQINNCQRPDRSKKNLFELQQEVRKYLRN